MFFAFLFLNALDDVFLPVGHDKSFFGLVDYLVVISSPRLIKVCARTSRGNVVLLASLVIIHFALDTQQWLSMQYRP